ncbi:excitatory amino acid transporter 1-like [Chiloscyllium plagiosum]|nr:excitatory amino acid transporter 1-like [Chiloscyllium plagiosum]
MDRIQQGLHKRTTLAKKQVQRISKDDVKKFMKNNGFVLFTVVAVVIG